MEAATAPGGGTIGKVTILGAGSAGLLAAAAMRRVHPDLPVTVLNSPDIPIIGVGEGTTISVTDFLHDFLRVNPAEFFAVANPTWKIGIRFNWGPRKTFYYPFPASVDLMAHGVPHPLGFYAGDQLDYVDPYSALMATDRAFARGPGGAPDMAARQFAYHFENERLVDYLDRLTRAMGVATRHDTVVGVELAGDGDDRRVTGLKLKSGEVERADLFVDCSGFVSTLLGGAMAEPFVSYQSTLFCDRAVVGGYPRRPGETIRPYTACDTMAAGWSWQIEHERRVNRGYVYGSAFISDEEADAEFRRANPRIDKTRVVKFVSGRYARAWVGNVVGIGNACGFVEPLEATAIGAICMQSRLLAEALTASGRQILRSHVRLYNDQVGRNWDSIRRFLAVHYKYNTQLDTPFWRAVRADCDLAGAEPIVDYYRESGPTSYWKNLVDPLDFAGPSGYFALLAGQDVPYGPRYEATAEQRLIVSSVFARHRQQAAAGLTVDQTLAIIRDPRWRWAA